MKEIKPIYLKEKNQIIFGYFPKTILSDNNIIEKLNQAVKPTNNIFFELDGEYYTKMTAFPFLLQSVKFSNGEIILYDKSYWFKVEPITWDIIDIKNDIYFIRTNDAIFNLPFDMDCKKYKESEILLFIREEVFNKAFFNEINTAEKYIQETEDNEKFFLLSEEEALLQKEEDRITRPTDYALAHGCGFAPSGCCDFWLRNEDDWGNARCVFDDGSIFENNKFNANVGVVVAAKIKL